MAGSFEGQTTIGLGVRARLPFRVFVLAGPGSGSRLVVDVAHAGSARARAICPRWSLGVVRPCSSTSEDLHVPLTRQRLGTGRPTFLATIDQIVHVRRPGGMTPTGVCTSCSRRRPHPRVEVSGLELAGLLRATRDALPAELHPRGRGVTIRSRHPRCSYASHTEHMFPMVPRGYDSQRRDLMAQVRPSVAWSVMAETASAREGYDPQAVERRWQERWRATGAYEIDNDDPRPSLYVLCMYPYPSGPAHMGHVRNYTFGDLIVRYRTMNGHGVLSPMGFDSFGLPAENAAIRTGEHPRLFTEARIAELTGSHRADRRGRTTGGGWSRATTRASCAGTSGSSSGCWRPGWPTARRRRSTGAPAATRCWPTSRCCADGTCERSGDKVERRELAQWFFKITEYADQLLDDLDHLDWPEKVKTMQRNWIGRSHGAEFEMAICAEDGTVEPGGRRSRVFTTRPDTSFGMTFCVLAPEHPLVADITTDAQRAEVEAFVDRVAQRDRARAHLGRGSAREARRVHRRLRPQPVHRPAGADLPGRLRPHGLRHRRHHGRPRSGPTRLGLRPGLRPPHRPHRAAAGGMGGRGLRRRRSGDQQRLARRAAQGRRRSRRPSTWLEERGIGRRTVNYRLRDWLLSRQRYWGCPIPVVYCDEHGPVPVPDDELPVLLPDDVEFRPDGRVAAAVPRGLPQHDLSRRAAARRDARPTRWTPSSTRRGTSCASAIPRNDEAPFTRRRSAAGCRSTSTSAGSSTPSST